MRITYLGHAGFCVESDRSVVVMDPWLSTRGAFDSAWFQFPRNHEMAQFVRQRLGDETKRRFVYISHEHQDHFDLDFLNALDDRNFTLVIARFRRDEMQRKLARYRCQQVLPLANDERVDFDDGYLKLYLDDSELNRDSAILVRIGDKAFLNQNDCKLFDALSNILKGEKEIGAYACQFSGATWHPTCYAYPKDRYYAISRRKVMTKFEAVARAIQTVRPEVFFPSAGPPCFLDPQLVHLNFEKINIFPRSGQLIEYLKLRLKDQDVTLTDPMPGDSYDSALGEFYERGKDRVTEETREAYLRSYVEAYRGFFETRAVEQSRIDPNAVANGLKKELEQKLEYLSLADRIGIPLYFTLAELPARKLRVDFRRKVVQTVAGIPEADFYHISAPAWLVADVLDRALTWEEFSLTFRVEINRNPDVYQPILHAYLLMDGEDLVRFCEFTKRIEENQERVIISAGTAAYSVLRYCPHQGGDLSEGWVHADRFLTCPRHRWQFDLWNGGRCLTNEASIHAERVPMADEMKNSTIDPG